MVQKLKITRNELRKWNKEVFGDVFRRKRILEERLTELQQGLGVKQNTEEERAARKELQDVLEQEQLMWYQKSRANWFVHGERNTKFYHTVTKRRRARNRITSIQGKNGQVLETTEEIELEFLNHFKEVYTNQGEASEQEIRQTLQVLDMPKLADEHVEILERQFTEVEVREATFQINPSKAPGIDGKLGVFFQKFGT
ncbi:hypothetical protein COLO4_22714 [Corchorus olitorius]|uniref:Reverse transcriptase n=1 Tax=Corchorus olitorius TaxID=93759 RepID=A0A1R3IKF1_9ROSI|nr:hypothetical protein COLO4_22714 [Corchorus olitorius]